MLNEEVTKGLKTLQREHTELVNAFVNLANQVKVLTGNMQILATEMAKLKKEAENGTARNEEEVEGSGEEEGHTGGGVERIEEGTEGTIRN